MTKEATTAVYAYVLGDNFLKESAMAGDLNESDLYPIHKDLDFQDAANIVIAARSASQATASGLAGVMNFENEFASNIALYLTKRYGPKIEEE